MFYAFATSIRNGTGETAVYYYSRYIRVLVFFMSMSGWCLDKEGGKSLLIVELFQF